MDRDDSPSTRPVRAHSPRLSRASGNARPGDAACIRPPAVRFSLFWQPPFRIAEATPDLENPFRSWRSTSPTVRGGLVEKIERDPEHVGLAELEIARHGYGDRIRVVRGEAADVLPELDGPYDLIFSDSDPDEMPLDLEHFFRLLRRPGAARQCESLPRSVRTGPPGNRADGPVSEGVRDEGLRGPRDGQRVRAVC